MNKEIVVSFVLALAVVGGALWMLNGQYTNMVKGTVSASPTTLPPSPRPQPADEAPDRFAPVAHPEASAQNSGGTPGQIRRCVVHGKTIYSDEKCPEGAESRELELHHAAGIVSPPKAFLSELTAQRKAAELAAEREMQQRAVRTAQSSRNECNELDNWIERLDSMARQLQSGQTQDWINEQRRFARDRQFAIHC